jgi:AbrB family looped-hinge helix DNA binding protein
MNEQEEGAGQDDSGQPPLLVPNLYYKQWLSGLCPYLSRTIMFVGQLQYVGNSVEKSEQQSQFIAQVDNRGRLVLPALVRQHLELKGGDEVVLTLSEDPVVQLSSRKRLAAKFRGLYKQKSAKASMVDELIAERRRDAADD